MNTHHLDPKVVAPLNRRQFLQLSGSMATMVALGLTAGDNTSAQVLSTLKDYPFALGIASGDPLPDGIVLWTRLAPKPLEPDGGLPPGQSVPVSWEVASDEAMTRVVQKGTALASSALAYSVHVEVQGLQAGHEYFYRFRAGTYVSPVGRTRTAPAPGTHVNKLAFAFASCQSWPSGFYSAYRRMAEENLDFVVFLGDYIYEGGIDSHGGIRGVPIPDQFRESTQTLERYRLQHALYKTDPDLQKAHALFPWIVTWDDHDVVNDYAGGPPYIDPASTKYKSERLFKRRAAAYQAFYEHLPLRSTSIPRGPDMLLYRRLGWGDLAEFSVLDTRQYRSQPPCGPGEKARCAAAFDPALTMTGPDQERWLLEGLSRSHARWNVIAQQVLMAQFDLSYGNGTKFWQDSWDGYPAARNRILSYLAARHIANPVVISGDWHSSFVNDLKMDFANPRSATVASEFLCTSISSFGNEEVYGPYYGPYIPHNPHIKFFDGDRRGYIRCVLDHDKWVSDFRMVTTVGRPDAPIYTLASFAVESNKPGAQLNAIYEQPVEKGTVDLLPGGVTHPTT